MPPEASAVPVPDATATPESGAKAATLILPDVALFDAGAVLDQIDTEIAGLEAPDMRALRAIAVARIGAERQRGFNAIREAFLARPLASDVTVASISRLTDQVVQTVM